MVRARRGTEPPTGPAQLTVAGNAFEDEVAERIALGENLAQRPLNSIGDIDEVRDEYRRWDDFNSALLHRRFTTSEVADEYDAMAVMWIGDGSPEDRLRSHNEALRTKINRLRSIKERIPLFEVPLFEVAASAREAPEASTAATAASTIDAIFIVHGHNDALKIGVDSFLRRATTVEPVILHNEANRGQTLIEKFEAAGARAGYAVVLFTADDVGAAKAKKDELNPRARQNVVFEFGFFVGAIGRDHVAVIHEPGVELPSDLNGLVYIPHDDAGAWKALLLRELKAAGITVDPHALL
jgi:predicted nucleotide-binding protein